MKKIINTIIVVFIGILSFMTVFKIGQQHIEFIPDHLRGIGNVDEAAAGVLLVKCLHYLGLDFVKIFEKETEHSKKAVQ